MCVKWPRMFTAAFYQPKIGDTQTSLNVISGITCAPAIVELSDGRSGATGVYGGWRANKKAQDGGHDMLPFVLNTFLFT